jgi:DNA repair photolyase
MPQHQPDLFDQTPVPTAHCATRLPGVIVRETPCRSLLNRSGIQDYSFNCYTGCQHGCAYCYARFMQRFHPHDEAWGQFVDVKINAVEVLKAQLRRLAPGSVFTCSACDGWQQAEAHYQLTRRCCQLLLEAGFSLTVLTKSDLVLRDLDLFAGKDVSLGATITTPDEAHARIWEPQASSVAARVRILKQAKAAGIRTHVMFGPLLPGVSDTPEALHRLFAVAKDADVDRIWTDALNARPEVWPAVHDLLLRHHPDLLNLYRRMLFAPAFREPYVTQLHQRVRQAARDNGVADRL